MRGSLVITGSSSYIDTIASVFSHWLGESAVKRQVMASFFAKKPTLQGTKNDFRCSVRCDCHLSTVVKSPLLASTSSRYTLQPEGMSIGVKRRLGTYPLSRGTRYE